MTSGHRLSASARRSLCRMAAALEDARITRGQLDSLTMRSAWWPPQRGQAGSCLGSLLRAPIRSGIDCASTRVCGMPL